MILFGFGSIKEWTTSEGFSTTLSSVVSTSTTRSTSRTTNTVNPTYYTTYWNENTLYSRSTNETYYENTLYSKSTTTTSSRNTTYSRSTDEPYTNISATTYNVVSIASEWGYTFMQSLITLTPAHPQTRVYWLTFQGSVNSSVNSMFISPYTYERGSLTNRDIISGFGARSIKRSYPAVRSTTTTWQQSTQVSKSTTTSWNVSTQKTRSTTTSWNVSTQKSRSTTTYPSFTTTFNTVAPFSFTTEWTTNFSESRTTRFYL